MLNIVLFGPPGAGKGTQSQKIVEKYKLVHLSTGDILRAEQAAGSYLGLEARAYVDKGELVPDTVVVSIIEKYIDRNIDSPGFIFDGFPRTVNQAKTLDELLGKKGTRVHLMLALEVDEPELKHRLTQRAQESGRADDMDPHVIRKRIEVYNTETSPVKDYYAKKGKYKGVYGVGSVELIFRSLCDVIDNANRTSLESEAVENVAETSQGHWDSGRNPAASVFSGGGEGNGTIGGMAHKEPPRADSISAASFASDDTAEPSETPVPLMERNVTVKPSAPKKKTPAKKKAVAKKKKAKPAAKKKKLKKAKKKSAPKKAKKSAKKKPAKKAKAKKAGKKSSKKKTAKKKSLPKKSKKTVKKKGGKKKKR